MNRKKESKFTFSLKQLLRFNGIFLILVFHFLLALFALFFANVEKNEPLSSQNRIVIMANNVYVGFLGDNFLKFRFSNYQNYYSVDENSAALTDLNTKLIKIAQAHTILLMLGATDYETKENLKILLDKMPPTVPVFWLSVPPVDNQTANKNLKNEILIFNQRIKTVCATKENCNFIDLTNLLADQEGNLRIGFHDGDGVRLNQRGFKTIEEALKSVIPQS